MSKRRDRESLKEARRAARRNAEFVRRERARLREIRGGK
jgi:hypothetical protein